MHMPSDTSVNAPPAAFIEQVHNLLERLHDFPYLQSHPLAPPVQHEGIRSDELAGQRLRRQVIEAIETLNPGREHPFLSPDTRLYNLLHMHYVDGMTVQNVAHELGISMRQAHRDLRRGEESVAMVLWARQPASEPSTAQAPTELFETHPHATDLCTMIERAHKAVEKLAEGRAVLLKLDLPDEPVTVWTDPVAAQQVWIGLLSEAIGHALPGHISTSLSQEGEYAHLTLYYEQMPEAAGDWITDPVVTDLAQHLEWAVNTEDSPGAKQRVIHVRIAMHKPTVLVIDDNKGLVELIERYLTGQPCRVVTAHDGPEGLRIALDLLPQAIILDVMMPGMDGWEALQTLRNNPRTAKTPVVICSVFNNPELAASLGATLYLHKPIRRDDILNALLQVGML